MTVRGWQGDSGLSADYLFGTGCEPCPTGVRAHIRRGAGGACHAKKTTPLPPPVAASSTGLVLPRLFFFRSRALAQEPHSAVPWQAALLYSQLPFPNTGRTYVAGPAATGGGRSGAAAAPRTAPAVCARCAHGPASVSSKIDQEELAPSAVACVAFGRRAAVRHPAGPPGPHCRGRDDDGPIRGSERTVCTLDSQHQLSMGGGGPT